MSDKKKQVSPRRYCMGQVKKVMEADYDPDVMEAALSSIQEVTSQIAAGNMLQAQLRKLLQAHNGERAIKLLEVAPFRHKHMAIALFLLALLVVAAGGAAVFFLSQ